MPGVEIKESRLGTAPWLLHRSLTSGFRGSWSSEVSSKAQACGKVSLCPRGLQVVTVDVRNKKAVFKDGFKLEYSKLLLAPGSR